MSYLSESQDSRVHCRPAPVQAGGRVRIEYDGILKRSGAETVYIHYGFDGWQNPCTEAMEKQSNGVFFAELSVFADQEINYCFKDSAGNWDNNSGWNWLAEVV